MADSIEISQDAIDKIIAELDSNNGKVTESFRAGAKWVLSQFNAQSKEVELKNEFELVKEAVLKMGFWKVDAETYRSEIGDLTFDSSVKFTDLKEQLHVLGQKHRANAMRKLLGLS